MRKWMFLAIASTLMVACSENDDPSPNVENGKDGSITFEISAINKLNDGLTRGNVYSQDAVQHVTRVSVYAFGKSENDYLYTRTYDIAGWSDGATFKRYAVGDDEKLPEGEYKFLAVGRDASDLFTVTAPTSTTSFSNMLASVQNSGDESEIFAGTSTDTVYAQGSRVNIEMTRKVAGVLGYFKNVPQTLNGSTVKYLRLKVSDANQQVNLINGVPGSSPVAPYNIIDMDLSGQATTGGVYVGNDLSGQGVIKVANSQLSGSFFIPISSVQMTLGLYDTSGTAIKEWVVKDSNGGASTFNILPNNFYSLGMKAKAGNVDGGTPDPGDDDAPVDLLQDQNLVITISPAWELIHNLVIQ